MTNSQKKRIEFLRRLSALLAEYEADIDLRDEGDPYHLYQQIDLNVGSHTTEMGDMINPDRLDTLITDLER